LGKYLEKISSFEIPFCQNVNEFCESIRNSLSKNEFLNKVKEIEKEFDGVIEKIQKELNKVTEAVEDIQNEITNVFQSVYGEAIVQAIDQELQARGTNFERYLQTQKEKECFRVSLPEIKIALKIANKKEVKREGNQVTVSVPVNIPTEISIPWPNELKNGITLINPITYKLPKIPLSGLSFEKEFSIKGPGFQPRSFFIDFGKINEGDCNRESPEGGNPFPIVEIESKIETMKNFKSEIENSSQKIKELLE
jgi:translation elongation factor EF-G